MLLSSFSKEAFEKYTAKESFLLSMGGDTVYVDARGMCFSGKTPISHYSHSGECDEEFGIQDAKHYLGRLVYKSDTTLVKVEPPHEICWF